MRKLKTNILREGESILKQVNFIGIQPFLQITIMQAKTNTKAREFAIGENKEILAMKDKVIVVLCFFYLVLSLFNVR